MDGGTQGAEERSGEVAGPGGGREKAITPSEGLPKCTPRWGGQHDLLVYPGAAS
uniref:Uncharacterized protein n=1 Tax=Peronospora matthiolae TaxID=2874970 RepID=A0AAV1TLA0_9STRA